MRGFVRMVLRAASSDCAHARARTPRSSNRRRKHMLRWRKHSQPLTEGHRFPAHKIVQHG
jgi:hypothetical protein